MPTSELIIPSWVKPESPDRIGLLDDQSTLFQPQFARNNPQVQVWSDPRWQFKRRYRGLRQDERGMLSSVVNEARGKSVTVFTTPFAELRGSYGASELFSNSTFANGTTGWSTEANHAITNADRNIRVKRVTLDGSGNGTVAPYQSVTLTQYVPYAVRFFMRQGTGVVSNPLIYNNSAADSLTGTGMFIYNVRPGFGLFTSVRVPGTTGAYAFGMYPNSTTGYAGDYYDVQYASCARCALVDVGVNKLLRSDEFDNASWSKTQATATANALTSPDGSTTGDALVDTAVNAEHYFNQAVTVASTTQLSYTFGVAVKAGSRGFVRLDMNDGTNAAQVFFNLTTGAVGTVTTGANWANVRGQTTNLGNGWWHCNITARKTSSSTTITCYIVAASADGTTTYTGTPNTAINLWRATFVQSAVPTRLRQTTSSSDDGGSPNGGEAYVKGLPASTNGLLLPYDWVELITSTGSELKQVTAQLDSDAMGLGNLKFRPGLTGQMLADAPIIVYQPFGRFRLMNGAEWEALYALYMDAELELTETYA